MYSTNIYARAEFAPGIVAERAVVGTFVARKMASADQLDDLWASFVDDARRESLSEPTPILRDERPGEASLANIEALDLAAADLPPALEATDKGEIART